MVQKKHKSIRKRIERVGIDAHALVTQTIDFDIKGRHSLTKGF